jgi:thiosulfate reductase cytochrome b subunit
MPPAHAVSHAPHAKRLHPLPIRIMHWSNAIVMIIMIGSGWKIYNDEVIFGWLHFPDAVTFGPYAQHGLQLHFFGMWILVLNGIAYVTYGFVTGRFRRMLLPIRLRDLIANIRDALRLKLAHDDPTQYNTVQRILYIGVLSAGVLIVISGLAIWKPIQLSELVALLGGFQTARLVHFLCMAAIVGFMAVHISLALLVPHTLVAMVTGGPALPGDARQPPPVAPLELDATKVSAVEASATDPGISEVSTADIGPRPKTETNSTP